MKKLKWLISTVALLPLLIACGGGGGSSSNQGGGNGSVQPPAEEVFSTTLVAGASCVDGNAADFPCSNIELLSQLEFSVEASDLWGWTDSQDGTEYALVGAVTGTVFINLANPQQPFVAGFLPDHSSSSNWRDIKVYGDYAFIVSEANEHGLQIFDLSRLRGISEAKQFTEDGHYAEFGSAHNIAIDEASGYAYVVGANSCGFGLHMIDINVPLEPEFAGCYIEQGFTHDSQCTVYQGLDSRYQGREICFNANVSSLVIVDVTDKSSPVLLSTTTYSGSSYSHQAWLTEDHGYLLMNDEGDEQDFGHNTRTYIWDMSDLTDPLLIGNHTATTAAIDHNLYVHGDFVYQANYTAGLRVLSIGDLAAAQLSAVAFFDTYPANDSATFNGAWSVYPYFESGVVIVSDVGGGLFVLRPEL